MFVEANVKCLVEKLQECTDDEVHVNATKAIGNVYWSTEFTEDQARYVLNESLRQLKAECDGLSVDFVTRSDDFPPSHRVDPPPATGPLVVYQAGCDDFPDDREEYRLLSQPGRRYSASHKIRLATQNEVKRHVARTLAHRILSGSAAAAADDSANDSGNDSGNGRANGSDSDSSDSDFAQPLQKLVNRIIQEGLLLSFGIRLIGFDWGPKESA
jgi:hypothetical protein